MINSQTALLSGWGSQDSITHTVSDHFQLFQFQRNTEVVRKLNNITGLLKNKHFTLHGEIYSQFLKLLSTISWWFSQPKWGKNTGSFLKDTKDYLVFNFPTQTGLRGTIQLQWKGGPLISRKPQWGRYCLCRGTSCYNNAYSFSSPNTYEAKKS